MEQPGRARPAALSPGVLTGVGLGAGVQLRRPGSCCPELAPGLLSPWKHCSGSSQPPRPQPRYLH